MPLKPTSPARNVQCGWYMAHLRWYLGLTEGTGSSPADYGASRGENPFAGSWAISTSGTPWVTDAEGPYIDGNEASTKVVFTPTSGSKTFTRYTLILRFKTPATMAGASKPLIYSHSDTSTANMFRALYNSSDDLQVGFELGATDAWNTASVSTSTDYVLVCRTDGTTQYLSLNGTSISTVLAGGSSDVLAAARSMAFDSWTLNQNPTTAAFGNSGIKAFAFFDEFLSDADVAEFLADPYLPMRAKVAECTTETNPVIGDVTDTTISFGITRSHDAETTMYFRTGIATTVAGLTSATYATAQSGSTARERYTFSHTGLTAHTTYYAIAEWSLNGTTWYRFPGGPMRVLTAPAAGTTNTVFDVIFATDSHTGHTVPAAGGPPASTIGYGLDTLYDADGSLKTTDGISRTNLCGGITITDIVRDETPDFLITGGDIEFLGSHETEGNTDDISTEMWDTVRKVRSFFNPLYRKCGMEVPIDGNHEETAGNNQHDENDTALQKQSRIALKGVRFGPYGTGYASRDNWVSPTDATHIATYVDDADGVNDDPLKSYWVKRWGPAVFVGLDIFTFSNLGVQDGVIDGPNWRLGRMLNYCDMMLQQNASAAWKVVVLHHGPGGGYSTANGWYGRNGITNMYEASYWTGNGASGIPAELTAFHALMRKHGVTAVIFGHDHKAAHYTIDEVNYLFGPSMGAQSVSGDSGASSGWHSSDFVAMFGTADVFGSDLSKTGVTVNWYGNKIGYTRFEVNGTTSFTVKFIETMEGLDTNYLPDKDISRQVGVADDDVLSDPGGTSLTIPTAARRVSQVLTETAVGTLTGTDWSGGATNYVDTDVAETGSWFDQVATTTVTLNADPNDNVFANFFPRVAYTAALTNATPPAQTTAPAPQTAHYIEAIIFGNKGVMR